jgi:hypothetical protein
MEKLRLSSFHPPSLPKRRGAGGLSFWHDRLPIHERLTEFYTHTLTFNLLNLNLNLNLNLDPNFWEKSGIKNFLSYITKIKKEIKMTKYLLLLFLPLLLVIGCGSQEDENLSEGMHKIEVLETMNASSYTYMRVEEGNREYWIAVPQITVNKGDVFYYSKALEMNNFNSASLNRTFDKILFVEDISKTPAAAASPMSGMNNPHAQVMGGKKDIKVEPLSGGKTVEQIYSEKESLSGKEVKLRGVVTKYNEGILDRNWIHIQDGTGTTHYDLIVTSTDETEEGKTVVVTGTVALNRDFGNGYAYEVLVENAKVE